MKEFFLFFTDPVLAAPTIGAFLMCVGAGLIGVILFLRKESLIGEALSHATYPGLMFGVMGAAAVGAQSDSDPLFFAFTMGGAFCASLIGLWTIRWLEQFRAVSADASLCLTLSSFFGMGMLLTSTLQFTHTAFYKKALNYLYGQVATMTGRHVWLYALLLFTITLTILLFYKEIQLLAFDKRYGISMGVPVRLVDRILFVLVAVSVMLGIRSVGIVLMSGMLIAPAVAARQWSQKLSTFFWVAACFGGVSGLVGTYLSVKLSQFLRGGMGFPTGPMIVLVGVAICVMSLLFAPQRGIVLRWMRKLRFRHRCAADNLLKMMWRFGRDAEISSEMIHNAQNLPGWHLRLLLKELKWNGWISRSSQNKYRLTHDGWARAAKIVRLHRLWEVYLVHDLGMQGDRVHRSAEEMEHIITPELEAWLLLLLKTPSEDPHQQPIPYDEGFS